MKYPYPPREKEIRVCRDPFLKGQSKTTDLFGKRVDRKTPNPGKKSQSKTPKMTAKKMTRRKKQGYGCRKKIPNYV